MKIASKFYRAKWLLLLISWWCCAVNATQQYSAFECDNLAQRLAVIKQRTNAGFDIKVNQLTTDKDLRLLREYHLHCQHPVDTVRVIRGAIQESQSAEFADTAIQDMPRFSANNAIFQGEKATAWADFYQVPSACRKKQLTESEFIACAEHKSDQRAKFEQTWQPVQSADIGQTQSALQIAPMPVISVAATPSVATPNQQAQLQYGQALDEQNQRFKWYGLVMILLMVVAGFLAWRT